MKAVTLYLAGDSTCQDYDPEETRQAGWGMYIGGLLRPEARIVNRAIGGRSSKSFIAEGRLEQIAGEIGAGDWLLVQLGHNDSTKDKPERYTEPFREYRGYLEQYIAAARERGAHTLFLTPVARLHWEDGRFLNDFADYCGTMTHLASEAGVPLIDLMGRSLQHLTDVGYEQAVPYYMVSVNGTDYTHFTAEGARMTARLVAEGIRELGIALSDYVK